MGFHSEIIERCFQVESKQTAELIPYKLWPAQRDAIDTLENSKMGDGHIWLKGASMGMSSCFLAYTMVECLTRENFKCVLITHEEQLAEFLIERAKNFIKLSQRYKIFDTKIDGKAKDYLSFTNGSFLFIFTAGSQRDVGRGQPVNMLIADEVAFWSDAGKIMTAILPRYEYALKVFLSTANGAGGWFYRQFKASMKKEGAYNGHFEPWFRHPDNRIEEIADRFTVDEREMMADYNLSPEQMSWRRLMISKLDDDPTIGVAGEDAFKQEYPTYWQEAFLKSGSPVFGPKIYAIIEKTIKKPAFVAVPDDLSDQLIKAEWGNLLVYKPPEKYFTYVFGVDPAEGLNKDDSVAYGFCRETGEEVALYKVNDEDPELFARNVAVIGKAYNDALLVPERNSVGSLVINILMEIYNRYKIWRSKNLTNIKNGKRIQYGWQTNKSNRPHLIFDLKRAIKNGLVTIRSQETLDEIQSFVKTREMRFEAAQGEKDDLVIAAALAWQGFKEMKILTVEQEKEEILDRRPTVQEWVDIIKNRQKGSDENFRRKKDDRASFYV
jgi:hypothetical protein